MRLIFAASRRAGTPVPGERVDADALTRLYAFPRPRSGRAWVRANVVSSVDGAAVGEDGLSGSINTPADNRVYGLQRSLCDAVLVGAGTARAEAYTRIAPSRRRPEPPALLVVSASGRAPRGLIGPQEGRGRGVLVTCASAGPRALATGRRLLGEADVWVCGDEAVDLAAVLGRCVTEGMPRVLAEGGPTLAAGLLAAGLLDELAVSTAPLLLGGDAGRIISGPSRRTDLRPHLMLEESGTVLALWRARR